MATRNQLRRDGLLHDARVLEEASRIARRRLKKPAGLPTAAFCRVLLFEADVLRREAWAIEAEA